MLPFLTLLNIVFVVLNFALSKEVFDFLFCVALFNLLVACFTTYVWVSNS